MPDLPGGADPMRLHRRLTLPNLREANGRHVIRSACSAKQVAQFERWNAINFGKQMAIVIACQGYAEIESVWKTSGEIIVVVRSPSTWRADARTCRFTSNWIRGRRP